MRALRTVRLFRLCFAFSSTRTHPAAPPPGTLEELIRHGLHALRETLQQDKELTISNTSIGIVGPAGECEKDVGPEGNFRILEGEIIQVYLDSMIPKDTGEAVPPQVAAAPAAGAGEEDVQMAE